MNFELDPMVSIFSLLRCANGLNRERAKFYGLSDLETIILIHIGHMINPSQKDISEKLGAPKQTVNNIIKNLSKEGLIDLIPCEDDKRMRILRLTPKGEEIRDERLKPISESNKRMYEKLGQKKALEIKNALRLLNDTIREDFKKEDE
uniref:MarR family winged helix-turn-helix transcriptional regulator n=1 Tax=Anaerococcus mediterraneensis TaxID=1870984 RepID=UPI00093152FC|nr:MarR family winged helix-turn-helix transcriptional regulator [Anaerococcus mediterraneensis]